MIDLVKIAKAHRDADLLVGGTYGFQDGWEGRGCSVGCFAKDMGYKGHGEGIHAFVAQKIGCPDWVILLQDEIFEGLPQSAGADWHVSFAEAISGVKDWQAALHRVHCAILDVALESAGSAEEQVRAVRDLHANQVPINDPKWSAAESAAWSAAESAAWSAAESAAESAAWSAAESAAWSAAESAARSAAWSAAESAAWSAAESAAWSAAESAAWSAAYQSLSTSIIAALREPAQ